MQSLWILGLFNMSEACSLTRTVEPLAARARMSAQDTVWGHASSNLDFILSITSKPRTEFLLGPEFFSLTILALSSNKIDASQPCHSKEKEQENLDHQPIHTKEPEQINNE